MRINNVILLLHICLLLHTNKFMLLMYFYVIKLSTFIGVFWKVDWSRKLVKKKVIF